MTKLLIFYCFRLASKRCLWHFLTTFNNALFVMRLMSVIQCRVLHFVFLLFVPFRSRNIIGHHLLLSQNTCLMELMRHTAQTMELHIPFIALSNWFAVSFGLVLTFLWFRVFSVHMASPNSVKGVSAPPHVPESNATSFQHQNIPTTESSVVWR